MLGLQCPAKRVFAFRHDVDHVQVVGRSSQCRLCVPNVLDGLLQGFGIKGVAIVEGHSLTELEGPLGEVAVRLPRDGEPPGQLVVDDLDQRVVYVLLEQHVLYRGPVTAVHAVGFRALRHPDVLRRCDVGGRRRRGDRSWLRRRGRAGCRFPLVVSASAGENNRHDTCQDNDQLCVPQS